MENTTKRVSVVTKITEANDRVAEENRKRFADSGVLVVDIMGSPGAGKTALLEAATPLLKERGLKVAVIVGDIETTHDAERVAAKGVHAVQITTSAFGGSCHLEASTVRQAVDQVDLADLDVLFVENVGNLVCPAEFDIGQRARAVVLSVTEGEDKPLKYPLAFSKADAVVISKTDLLPYLRVKMDLLRGNVRNINPQAAYMEVSSQGGEGMTSFIDWLASLKK